MTDGKKGNTRKHYRHGFVTLDARIYREKSLSLKEKGMIGTLFSLPDDWDFSAAGLASILSESKNTVNSILHSLEEKGYLKRTRIYKDGKVADWFYDFYDYPAFPVKEEPVKDDLDPKNEDLENEDLDFQDLENEDIENWDDNLYIQESNKQKPNKKESNNDDKKAGCFDMERFVAGIGDEIARINEANRSNDLSSKAVEMVKEVCECYGKRQLSIINSFSNEEYRKLFMIACSMADEEASSSIINGRAYLSSAIGKCIAAYKT